MVSLRFLTLRAVMAAAVLPLACASGSRSSGDTYPWGMFAFPFDYPPRCPYEEVGRLSYEGDKWVQTGDFEGQVERQQNRADRKEQLLAAYEGFEADAFIEPRWDLVKVYSFIRFTDSDCLE